MKLNLEPKKANRENRASGATGTTQPGSKPRASKNEAAPKRLRRLKWNELVSLGDFVADEHRGFEPWEGPSGFQADAFVRPIYRRVERRSIATK
jgi:hypothetical protein